MVTIERVAHGLHEPATGDTPDLRRNCARLLTVNPESTVVAGLAAAALHRLWLPGTVTRPEFATTKPETSNALMPRSRRPEFDTHRWRLRDCEITVVDGIPITTMERTWWDVAGRLSLADHIALGDSALRLGADPATMASMVREKQGHRGNAWARRALELLDARSRSRAESHLRVTVCLAGLRCFEANVAVTDRHGQWLAEPDLSCADARIALEYQGAEHAELTRMRKDITRFTDLRREGWLVLAYGPAEVFRRPEQIAPELRTLVRRRAPQLPIGRATGSILNPSRTSRQFNAGHRVVP